MKILSMFGMAVLGLMATAGVALADEALCQELRGTGNESCYHQNDQRRAECPRHCARCGAEAVACFSYCEHFCDTPYPEGCGFDLNDCASRCAHRCHEPACAENAGCRSTWCGKDAIKTCTDSCQTVYASLAGCRSAWCGDGKPKKSCVEGCNTNQPAAAACRKAWCGDGKDARQCYRDADDQEQQCFKQVEADYKACLSGSKKP